MNRTAPQLYPFIKLHENNYPFINFKTAKLFS